MPVLDLNDCRLHYQDSGGTGPAVLLVAGLGSAGRTWHLHQVPALTGAGFRVVTFDARGLPPSDTPPVVTADDLVADAAGLIERLALGRCRVVGTSMGARVTAELCLRRPELVDRAVLMAAFGRPGAFLAAMGAGERALLEQKAELPEQYRAAVRAAVNLSPRTLADRQAGQDWLDLFRLSPAADSPSRMETGEGRDRLVAYGQIAVPTLVLAFADDLLTPARGCREVAAAIPGARYAEIPDAGHYGYLEQPARTNAELIGFLR